ncbi:hypothetical protein [Streptomyces halobius]|uniref:Uncharacterized protein n=1 Tax=Streptomyces halobius TaxID=2879846 RepID=A0ABY4M2B0_9ACTN|nr:hypothetical protein [Streptomyces halobius]UQA91894.1 hypothetical protein K9S39_08525 [Streptomyces halobius]
MIESVLPPLSAAAAIALTYVFCIRPMRQGRGCHTRPGRSRAARSSCGTAETIATDRTDAEITRLRGEIRLLQRELDLRSTDTVRLEKDESC